MSKSKCGVKYLSLATDILLAGILSLTVIFAILSWLVYSNNFLYDFWQIFSANNFVGGEQVRLAVNNYFLQLDQKVLSFFTAREQAHLVEITAMIMAVGSLWKIGLGFILVAIGWLAVFRKASYRISRLLRWSVVINFLLFLFFVLATLFDFSVFFIAWHQLVFNNDWWLLPPESMLIQTYPESFFNFMFIIWLIFLLIFSIVFMVISLKIKKYMYQREPDSCPGCGGDCDCGQ